MLLVATGYEAKWDGVRCKGETLIENGMLKLSPECDKLIKLQKSRGQRGEDKEEGKDTP